jgi:hypothetical protein
LLLVCNALTHALFCMYPHSRPMPCPRAGTASSATLRRSEDLFASPCKQECGAYDEPKGRSPVIGTAPCRRPVPSTSSRLPIYPSQLNPARLVFAGLLHAEAPQGHSSHCTQALAWSRVQYVLLTCMYCTHTVIMRSSLDTASKRAGASCHRNLV